MFKQKITHIPEKTDRSQQMSGGHRGGGSKDGNERLTTVDDIKQRETSHFPEILRCLNTHSQPWSYKIDVAEEQLLELRKDLDIS